MPQAYEIDVTRRIVLSRAWGVSTARDLVDHYAALAADPQFDPTFSQLVDLRGIERFDVPTPVLRREALEPVFASQSPRALVASSDVGFGLSRVYSAHAELVPQNVRVFRDIADAERWLGLSDSSGFG